MTRLADQFEKELMSTWLDSSSTGFCVLDSTSQVVSINRAFCKLVRAEPERALGLSVRSLFMLLPTSANFINWLGSGEGNSERTFSFTQNEQIQHVLFKMSSLTFHTGDVFKVLSATDVTQLHDVRTQLEQNTRRWQALNAGVVVSDANAPDMPIVFINKAFEEMTGYTAPEVIGFNCRFLQGDDPQPEALAPIREAIKNGSNGYALLRNYRKDGSLFMNELFISPIRGHKGAVTHFIGVQHIRREPSDTV